MTCLEHYAIKTETYVSMSHSIRALFLDPPTLGSLKQST